MNTFSPDSKVWIYQSSRPLTELEAKTIQQIAQTFAEEWVSHNRMLKAAASVQHGRFVVLMVDESVHDASGCSIDKSVQFMRRLGEEFGIDFFDRMTFAWMENGQLQTAHRDEFAEKYRQGLLNDETLVFDNLVPNKAAMESRWLLPLGSSWHKRMV